MTAKKNTLLITCLLFLTHNSFATTPNIFSNWRPDWVATLSAGPVWQNGGSAQTITLTPGTQKTYTNNSNSSALLDADLFLGLVQPAWRNVVMQYGIDVATTGNASLSGNIWDDANPDFNNYTYKYEINHSHLNLKTKLLADMGYFVTPWLSVSAGIGFNNAHDFSNTPTIFQAIASPNFGDNTTTSFNYTIGLGFERQINPHWQTGVSYEFADWGSSELRAAPGQTTGNGLSLSHFYTSGIMLNITYTS